jgi:hypothetical protein
VVERNSDLRANISHQDAAAGRRRTPVRVKNHRHLRGVQPSGDFGSGVDINFTSLAAG